jgi:ActR/RegA family two-component response regulator
LGDHRDAYIARVLDACDGNRSEAARRLRIHRYSLQRMLAKLSAPAGRQGRRKKQR